MAAPKKGASRRQLVILAGGGALLAVLLAIQLPGLLGGGGDPVAEPVAPESSTTPSQPSGDAAATVKPVPASLAALSTADASPEAGESQLASFGRFASKNPFEASSAGGQPVGPTSVGPATSLGVRLGRGADIAPPPAPPPVPRPQPRPLPRPGSQTETSGGYTVIVRSIPVSRGRGLAEAEARNVRRDGVRVRVRVSSDYSTLRPGYYIVSMGIYRTYASARAARDAARARGYERAYARRLLR